jgi:hypothetical protein
MEAMSADETPEVEIPSDVPMEDLERWERHVWRTPELSVQDRAAAILLIHWVHGDLAGETPELRKLYNILGEALREQEGP